MKTNHGTKLFVLKNTINKAEQGLDKVFASLLNRHLCNYIDGCYIKSENINAIKIYIYELWNVLSVHVAYLIQY